VESVTLILGNDLAGNKVQSNLQVVNSSKQALHPSPMANGSSDVYPTCVVTRAAARRAQEQEKDLPMGQPVTPADSIPDQAQGRPSTRRVMFWQIVLITFLCLAGSLLLIRRVTKR